MMPRPTLHSTSRRLAAACALAVTAATAGAQAGPSHDVTAFMTSKAVRTVYLASAVIWERRDVPTPEQIVEGPPGRYALSRRQANPPEGLPCTYESGGAAMGGKTDKFTCRMADGRSARIKYFSGDALTGNREIFAEVPVPAHRRPRRRRQRGGRGAAGLRREGLGTTVHVAAVGFEGGRLVNVATTVLGDRVQLEHGEIKDGLIVLDVLRPTPDDPMCCPTGRFRVSYRVRGHAMQRVADVPR